MELPYGYTIAERDGMFVLLYDNEELGRFVRRDDAAEWAREDAAHGDYDNS